MNTEFVSIKAPIYEWISDVGADQVHDEINDTTLVRWASDVTKFCITDEQLAPKIGLYNVKSFKTDIGYDVKIINSVAGNPDFSIDDCKSCKDGKTYYPNHPCHSCKDGHFEPFVKTRRENVVQWLQGCTEGECHMEINLVCPKCNHNPCSCDGSVIHLDVDRLWEMAHPEIFYKNYSRLGRFGYGPMYGTRKSKFTLMRVASNDFWNLKQFISNCPMVDCKDCYNSFKVDLPYITTDFEKGEILVSYLGLKTDENGDLMVPDHPDVMAAIFWQLESKWWYRKYRGTTDRSEFQIYRDKYQNAEQQKERHIGLANSALQIPDQLSFKNFLENVWLKRIPEHHAHENFNKLTEGQYERYSRLLK